MIQGTYFDGKTSRATNVAVRFESSKIQILGLEDTLELPVDSVVVSEPLGRTKRSILLENGARIEVPDTPELDRLGGRKNLMALVHVLERRWKYALLAVGLVVGLCWAFVTVGIPVAAKHVAVVLPATVVNTISEQSVAQLDLLIFKPTKLARKEQDQINELFLDIVQYANEDYEFRLEFRSGGAIGANALALPSGIVIVTDELVKLADSDEELTAVLAHEIGHVVNQHPTRLLLQSSAIAMLVAAFSGDTASLSSVAGSIPTDLVWKGYSREFEREADAYAYKYLEFATIPAERLANFLERLEESHGAGMDGVLGYLSTHPPASERTKNQTSSPP